MWDHLPPWAIILTQITHWWGNPGVQSKLHSSDEFRAAAWMSYSPAGVYITGLYYRVWPWEPRPGSAAWFDWWHHAKEAKI